MISVSPKVLQNLFNIVSYNDVAVYGVPQSNSDKFFRVNNSSLILHINNTWYFSKASCCFALALADASGFHPVDIYSKLVDMNIYNGMMFENEHIETIAKSLNICVRVKYYTDVNISKITFGKGKTYDVYLYKYHYYNNNDLLVNDLPIPRYFGVMPHKRPENAVIFNDRSWVCNGRIGFGDNMYEPLSDRYIKVYNDNKTVFASPYDVHVKYCIFGKTTLEEFVKVFIAHDGLRGSNKIIEENLDQECKEPESKQDNQIVYESFVDDICMLADMGFTDIEANKRLYKAHKGNIAEVIAVLAK